MIQIILGAQLDQLDELRRQIESCVSIEFELHDSLYHGGEYFLSQLRNGGPKVLVKRNVDAVDNTPVLKDHADRSLLVYISGNRDVDLLGDQLLNGVPKLHILKREETS